MGRDGTLLVRLSAEEKDLFGRAARAEGLSMAAWLRRAGLREASRVFGELAPLATVEPGPTVAELCERFWTEYSSVRLRNPEAYRYDARLLLATHVVPALGSVRAELLSSEEVERLRDELRARRSAQTVIHVLNRLSRAYRWAMRQRIVRRTDNPVIGVERPVCRTGTGPVMPGQVYSAEECRRLLAYAREHEPLYATLIAVAIYTGARQGSIARLRWDDVDLDGLRVVFRATKSGRDLVAPISDDLLPWIREWRVRTGGYPGALVFLAPKGGGAHNHVTLDRALHRCAARAGLKRIRFHDLRHTAASLWLARGRDLLEVARLLGHSRSQMSERYGHLAHDRLREAVNSVRLGARRAIPAPLAKAGEIKPIGTIRREPRNGV